MFPKMPTKGGGGGGGLGPSNKSVLGYVFEQLPHKNEQLKHKNDTFESKT